MFRKAYGSSNHWRGGLVLIHAAHACLSMAERDAASAHRVWGDLQFSQRGRKVALVSLFQSAVLTFRYKSREVQKVRYSKA